MTKDELRELLKSLAAKQDDDPFFFKPSEGYLPLKKLALNYLLDFIDDEDIKNTYLTLERYNE